MKKLIVLAVLLLSKMSFSQINTASDLGKIYNVMDFIEKESAIPAQPTPTETVYGINKCLEAINDEIINDDLLGSNNISYTMTFQLNSY